MAITQNTASNIEQVLETALYKAAAYHPSRKLSKLYELDMQDTAGDELLSDVLLWAPSQGRAKSGRQARTCNGR